ncbi:NADPH-dependent FMN reductase [Raineyella fluvialis]|uniref:NADPH-dependent FMN reductase n=1 Tax=Raineyella fluvialis TaxID=2662261 RepID=A0A5Q2F874_9ACTN|nr:NADPH-dependent FMN reductase [Raineyella fluvialis]QGF22651.1 NADPH-dependent FMN reductase [Raineyella fluvialis]
MTRIGIIVGSTRPHRHARDVAEWALELASQRGDATYELIDLLDHPLPLLDEPLPPSRGRYEHEHTRQWAATVAGFDAFVIVTPEYNHSVPAVLKNALDYLYGEWNHKAVGFISYGTHGGVRAVEHLRGIAGELMMADVRAQVVLPFASDFDEHRRFTPREHNIKVLHAMLDQVVAWGEALAPVRHAQR